MLTKPKLRTCVNFKDSFNTYIYVKQTLFISRCSFLAQLGLEILPLEIESDVYVPIQNKTNKINRRIHIRKNFNIQANISFRFSWHSDPYISELHNNCSEVFTVLQFCIICIKTHIYSYIIINILIFNIITIIIIIASIAKKIVFQFFDAVNVFTNIIKTFIQQKLFGIFLVIMLNFVFIFACMFCSMTYKPTMTEC